MSYKKVVPGSNCTSFFMTQPSNASDLGESSDHSKLAAAQAGPNKSDGGDPVTF